MTLSTEEKFELLRGLSFVFSEKQLQSLEYIIKHKGVCRFRSFSCKDCPLRNKKSALFDCSIAEEVLGVITSMHGYDQLKYDKAVELMLKSGHVDRLVKGNL